MILEKGKTTKQKIKSFTPRIVDPCTVWAIQPCLQSLNPHGDLYLLFISSLQTLAYLGHFLRHKFI